MVQNNAIGWFEIPVTDMARAMKFYETVLDVKLELHDMGKMEMAWFPMDPESYGSGGTLFKLKDEACEDGSVGAMYKPSNEGIVIYFTAKSGDCANELARVKEAGGKVLVEKKDIGEHGFIGIVVDTEGNKIGIHSLK